MSAETPSPREVGSSRPPSGRVFDRQIRSRGVCPRAGDTGGLDLTRVASLVTDYDMNIAQASVVADPIVDDVAGGTRLFARAAPSPGGTWVSLILRRGDPRELDLGVAGLGTLDQSTHDQLFVREKLVFGKGEGSPRRFVLGEVSEPPAAGSLTLEVEAAEVK